LARNRVGGPEAWAAGIAEAHERLTATSVRLCRRLPDDRKVADWEDYVACVHDTLAKALEKFQRP
jgi:hypothetical protein